MLTAPKEVQESALHDYAIVEPDKAGDGYYEDMSVSYIWSEWHIVCDMSNVSRPYVID